MLTILLEAITHPAWVIEYTRLYGRHLLGRSRPPLAEFAIDLVDRAATRLDADEPEGDRAEHVPEREVVKAGDQRVEGRLQA